MQLTAEQQEVERVNSELLVNITGVDIDIAVKALRKHNGDMEKAADDLLNGYRGQEWETKHRTTPEPMYSDGLKTSTSNPPAASTSVIDLTNDDDDMTRAIQLSMETSSQVQSQTNFGPSDRAPHPEWQMVRSNVM